MPLPAGVTLDRNIHPPESWPPHPPASLVAAPLGRGNGRPARVAEDGTRWCAYWDHTVEPYSKITRCTPCAQFRDRLRHAPVGEAFVSLPVDVVSGLVAAAAESTAAVARANGRRNLREDLTTTELDALIATAFNVNSIVDLVNQFIASSEEIATNQ